MKTTFLLLGATLVLAGAAKRSVRAEEIPARYREVIHKGLEYVAAERLVAAPDCGMKYLPRDLAFAKLSAMANGAAIVRRELGG